MNSSKAGIRYAKAVLQQANEAKSAEIVFEDMLCVAATIDGSQELQSVLLSPIVKLNDKKAALLSIFANLSPNSLSLINVLIENQRIALLGEVAKGYMNLFNEERGIKVAKVITAVPLSEELEAMVLAKVKELTGSSSVTIENEVDASIIGGFILRIGDLQYNASIANQLGNLKREFSKSL